MVQAYRDTWELGVHSWLTYMRDRLLLARELLTDSGSCFVQISDENVHHVREIMDEVFGAENFARLITYRTTSGLAAKLIPTGGDYIVWYAKNLDKIKCNQLFVQNKSFGRGTMFTCILKADGEDRPMNEQELDGFIEKGDKPYQSSNLSSSGLTPSCVFDFEFEGRTFKPVKGKSWRTNEKGMENLRAKERLHAPGKTLRYISFHSDFPVGSLSNFWTDAAGEANKKYVVQTSSKIVQRCLLMTTEPGDLVFDPTCGSGTTAYVAEQWGRRWITTDVSRVPLAIARQRLLTATYPYYRLQDEALGPGGGFVYKRRQNKKGEEVGGIVPHISLKSIARGEPPAEEVLVDKPEKESNVTRISGPFCVEAVLPTPLSPEADRAERLQVKESGLPDIQDTNEENHIPRMIKVLQLSPILHLPNNNRLELGDVRPVAKSMNLHAEGKNIKHDEIVAVVFGPANGAISERAVVEAGKEASHKGYARLIVIAFAVEPAARQTIEKGEATFGVPSLYAQATTDLVMPDLLKTMRSSQIFSIVGLPDIELKKTDEQAEDGGDLWQVILRGLDIFDPANMEHIFCTGDEVPCWMLDTDYDGQCFRAGQVFFPRTEAWKNIHRAVQADFEDTVWDHLRGNTSAPFTAGEQIAVKVIDVRGNELMVVKRPNES